MNTEFLKQVEEFHKVFKHPALDTPQIPDANRVALRTALLEEELQELREACLNKDLVEIVDALADLQYVLSGAILEFGLGDKFLEIFNEVHRSNMSKACKTEAEAIATIEFYNETRGIKAYYEQDKDTGLYIVYRKDNNKILKSIEYSPANIKLILEK